MSQVKGVMGIDFAGKLKALIEKAREKNKREPNEQERKRYEKLIQKFSELQPEVVKNLVISIYTAEAAQQRMNECTETHRNKTMPKGIRLEKHVEEIEESIKSSRRKTETMLQDYMREELMKAGFDLQEAMLTVAVIRSDREN